MNQLDLHGTRHLDVDLKVENFVLLNQNEFPLTILCGNSARMIAMTEKVLNRLDIEHTMYRYGIIIVERFRLK